VTQPSTRPNNTIAVDVAADGWRTAIAGSAPVEAVVVEAAQAALASAGPAYPVEIGVRLTGDAEMRTLNRSYRGRDSATNVLSFALADDDAKRAGAVPGPEGVPELLGDIVIAYETCVGEAAEQTKSLADHLRHMVVHGVLHLLGYDHQTDGDATHMEGLEREILSRLGVSDPYARAAA
jgi:probable rRNA maturation factor